MIHEQEKLELLTQQIENVIVSGGRIQVKTTEQGERLYLKRQKGDRLNKTVKYFMYSTDDFDFLFVVKFPKIFVHYT